MGTNNIERAYDLIEKFDFHELLNEDKMYILSIMTEVQYNDMRRTMTDIKVSFENNIEPIFNIPRFNSNKGVNKFLLLVNYRVPIYKVAASIAIIIATNFVIQKSNPSQTNQLIASNDTVFIHQIDTVYTKVYDTLRIVGNRLYSLKTEIKENENMELTTQSNQSFDCNKELCPNEVGKIISLNNKNNISSDSALNGLLVKMN